MSVPFVPSSSIDDAEARNKHNGIHNPYSNDRVIKRANDPTLWKEVKKEDSTTSNNDLIPKESDMKSRQEWANKNLPPLEYLSLSFSSYLLVLMYLNLHKGQDTVYTCTLISRGGYFYFTFDSILEIFVLNRYKYIFHHIIALIIFTMIGSVEQLHPFYTLDMAQSFMPILAVFEVSTILLNIRSLVKEFVFNVKKKSNLLADATFTEGSLNNNESTAQTTSSSRRELYVELFFILTYGGIRLLIAPYLLLTRGRLLDPIIILGFVLVAVSCKWVLEWIEATKKRYGGDQKQQQILIKKSL